MINNAKGYVRSISKPRFISQKKFSKNFVAIHKIKPVLTFNKPIYVGFSILDLSKVLMCEFHYKYIKSKFYVNLLFTDTGSLVYDFYQDKNLFDFNDYPLEIQSFLIQFIKKLLTK